MAWNWQHSDWPLFRWNAARLERAEQQFLVGGGVLLGSLQHLDDEARSGLIVQAIAEEAVTSSEIEGEMLRRDSVQSSIQQQLGLSTDDGRATPAEHGMASMTVDLYRHYADPLRESMLFDWHSMVMQGRRDLRNVGAYRDHESPMVIVSGRMYEPTIHFEAPPSDEVPREMNSFIDWFNRTAPDGPDALPVLTRAALAHLHFESIHPFEDGNGRVGRAIAEKVLAQGLGTPTLTALASTILRRRVEYYRMLEENNKDLDVDAWTAWFAGIALEAQDRTANQVQFLIDKSRLLNDLRDQLSSRQMKVLLRVFREGPSGFKGGLSSSNYQSIAKTSSATATRDLADLVAKGALERTGSGRHTRYQLSIPLRPTREVRIDDAGAIIRSDGPVNRD